MNGWTSLTLGEVIQLEYGKPLAPKDRNPNGLYPAYGANGEKDRTDRFYRGEPTIIVGRKGSAGQITLTEERYWPLDVAYFVEFDRQRYDRQFLYYLLATLDLPSLAKGIKPGINRKDVYAIPVMVPSLSEQRRIAVILDGAFESIATAKADAEKNLRNARAVFETFLQDSYTVRVGHMSKTRLEDLCERKRLITYGVIKLGDPFEGGVPCLRTSNVRWLDIDTNGMKRIAPTLAAEYSRTILRGGEVLVNVRGTLGGVAVVPNEMAGWNVSREVAVVPVEASMLDAEYAAFWIGSRTSQIWLSGVKKGTAYTGINIEDLRDLPVPLPRLEEQRAIVNDLVAIRDSTRRMEEIYTSKLDALDELKRSLLHEAFRGQLTSNKKASIAAIAAQMTSPEFSANVIALAYARHMRQRREKTFGRVKEQKLLHLVEAIGKVDLGRQPRKDAAGPNDFQHMLKAEDWARQNNYFELTQREGGYDLKRLLAFDKLLARAPDVLGPCVDRIEAVIDLLIPMDTQEVEVFATVHAAWNNLLIEGSEVTDESILREAREEWHVDKLAIPESRFRQAIALIQSKGLAPDGSGKYVGGQKFLEF